MKEQFIFENEKSKLYKSDENEWGKTVLLKVLNYEFPSPSDISQFYNEFDISEKLNLDCIRKPLKKGKYKGRHCIYFEWVEGETLRKTFGGRKNNIAGFLKLAITISQGLGELHQEGIIHKDVNPNNIIIDSENKEAKLISLNLATKINLKEQHLGNPEQLSGTLSYLSPEQTGRMNRRVDYRTDLYSLGVTFYEMLAGDLPFKANDALEMVHSHIAIIPEPVIKRNKNIPKPISDIIQRLLEKKAEDRYQSAFGLKHDLEICLEQFLEKDTVEEFKFQTKDFSGKFSLPQKLYGRDNEISTLLGRFENVAQGDLEMILISGYSGTGKSVLVREIHKPVTEKKGYFIEGKFDQYQRAVPYYAIFQAFNSFINILLGENAEYLEQIKERLIESIGEEGKVLTDVLPSLELIIGPQKDVPELGGTETRNRFNYVFRKFVTGLSTEEHPIVLFIDDLQWADSSSLNLLETLMTDPENKYLLCIGAYRDNEVDASHPFILTVKDMKEAGAKISDIKIGNLSFEDINHLLSDALSKNVKEVKGLAELVLRKTQGNAFFVTQFLESLYQDELLQFNFDNNEWNYSLEEIEKRNITENVVELIAGKAKKLPEKSLDALMVAACVGSTFSLDILSLIHDREEGNEAETDIQAPLFEGMILPSESDYKFTHDRIQQAVYSLIPEGQRDEMHLRIGRLIIEDADDEKMEKYLFDITNHLNSGVKLIHDEKEIKKLCELNYKSGMKAKEASAFKVALEYLETGIDLLPDNHWAAEYETSLGLHALAAETAYMNGDFQEMNKYISKVLNNATDLLDKVKSYEIRILAFKAENKLLDAIKTGLELLEQLGEKFPKKPILPNVMMDLVKTKFRLRGKNNDILQNLPLMTNEKKIAAMRIMADIASSSYWATPTLFPLLVFRMVHLSLKYGNTAVSSFAFATYGVILCGVLGSMKEGYQYGKLGLILLDKLNAKEWKTQIYTPIYCLIVNWNEHIDETLKPLQESYHIGMETGAIEFACVNTNIYCIHSFLSGKRLEGVEKETEAYSRSFNRFNQGTNFNYNEVYRQGMLNLMGECADPLILTGRAYNEEKMIAQNKERNDQTGQFFLHFNKLIICYILNDNENALYHSTESRKLLEAVLAKFEIPNHHFYEALNMLELYPNAKNKRKLMSRVNKTLRQMKKWAKDAPQNFQHKYDIIYAKKLIVLNKNQQVKMFLDKGIEGADKYDFIHEAAIGREIAGKYFLQQNEKSAGEKYLKAAYTSYREWGAKAKTRQMDELYPEYVSDLKQDRVMSKNVDSQLSESITSKDSSFLDINTILKSSSIISSEIVLEKLLKTLLKIVMENAGANKGVVLLKEDNEYLIQAASNNPSHVDVLQNEKYQGSGIVPESIISYVIRTQESQVLDDAKNNPRNLNENYWETNDAQSVLCFPILNRGDMSGVLYLENNLITNAFTQERIELLSMLSGQIAVSLNNAILYENLEQKVSERTYDLQMEKKKTEELLVNISEQKKELEKLNLTKDRMFGIIGHDLRKPVIAFRGIAKKINYLLRKEDFATLKSLGEGIERDALGLNALTDNLLNWALTQKNALPYNIEKIELLPNVEEIILTLNRLAEDKNLELNHDINDGVEILADRNSLLTILRNLVDNAIKFTPSGGKIFISAKHTEFGVDVEVSDTGVGIPAEKLDNIFELQKNKTTKGTIGEKGTGLGLHLVHEMVELNKGEIKVLSEIGKGTRFIVSLKSEQTLATA